MDLFDVLPMLENLTENDLEEVLHLHFSDESRTTLIVKGNKMNCKKILVLIQVIDRFRI